MMPFVRSAPNVATFSWRTTRCSAALRDLSQSESADERPMPRPKVWDTSNRNSGGGFQEGRCCELPSGTC